MPPAQPPPQDQQAVLDGLSLLARLYWGPDQQLCQEMCGPAVRDLLARLTCLLPSAAPTLRSLQALLQDARSPQVLREELETAYVAAHVNSPQGVGAPLYHSCYVGQGLVMGPPAAAMAQRLEQDGLTLGEKSGEPPDHLSVELEYLGFLWEHDPDELREPGANRAGDLARRFMLPWVREFARRQADSPYPLLSQTAKLLVSLLEYVADRAESGPRDSP